MIAGIVLAAGAATRMGMAKQALPYEAGSMLGAVIAAAVGSSLDRVIVVVGHHAAAVEPLLDEGVTIARNPDPDRGNLSSLLAGLAVAPDAEAIVLLLGDHPETRSSDIDAVIAAWRSDGPPAVVCDFQGTVTHPFLLSAGCLDDVKELRGPKPLWRHLVEDPSHDVAHVAIGRAAPIDVDTPADYRRLTGIDPLPPGSAGT